MLKLKEGVTIEDLKNYGYKRSRDCSNYYRFNDEFELFIQVFNTDEFKKGCVYIEIKDYSMILTNLDIIYDLVKNDLVEKV